MQIRPAQAETLHDAGAKAFDQHVRVGQHREQRVAPRGVAQVEPQQLLAVVEHAKGEARAAGGDVVAGASHVARRIVLPLLGGAFDLDDFGAEFDEVARCQRARQQTGQIDDPDSGQRQIAGHVAHSNRPSRSHLVATHFSPSSTGAPP